MSGLAFGKVSTSIYTCQMHFTGIMIRLCLLVDIDRYIAGNGSALIVSTKDSTDSSTVDMYIGSVLSNAGTVSTAVNTVNDATVNINLGTLYLGSITASVNISYNVATIVNVNLRNAVIVCLITSTIDDINIFILTSNGNCTDNIHYDLSLRRTVDVVSSKYMSTGYLGGVHGGAIKG